MEEGEGSKPLHHEGVRPRHRLFEELHGSIAVANITRSHVRQYREALQAIPVRRSGALRQAALPQLVDWSKRNSDQPRLAPRTINKLLAGPAAIAAWAHDNGIIPDDASWANPFAKMLLDVEPWEITELRTLFMSPVFGREAYWLPLLGMFTGARLSELASLAPSDIVTDDATGIVYFRIAEDEGRGRKLKTASSRRVIPVHTALVRLGFLESVVEPRRAGAAEPVRLFPELVPGPRGNYSGHWSKWFGRYIRKIGIQKRPVSSTHFGTASKTPCGTPASARMSMMLSQATLGATSDAPTVPKT